MICTWTKLLYFYGISEEAIKCINTCGYCSIRKTRDLFKKIRNTKGKFQAKIGTIKDRNGMDLKAAEEKVARIHRRTV